MPKNATRDFWSCNGCNGKKCGYLVPRGKYFCDACGNQPPAHVSAARGGRAAGDGPPPRNAGGRPASEIKKPDAAAKAKADSPPPNGGAAKKIKDLEERAKKAEAALSSSELDVSFLADMNKAQQGGAAMKARVLPRGFFVLVQNPRLLLLVYDLFVYT